MKLERRLVAKPWGRTSLPAMFGTAGGERIGEIWFADNGLPLLAKYLFTSERLSIQVHPGDSFARSAGHARGKDECWFVLDAEPGATIGRGWKRAVTGDEVRRAAGDGSIVDLLDWKPARAGDFYYVPPGTVHALGAGLSLVEFQRNSDITYRLYDYGRDRPLHLDDALAVADLGPSEDPRAGAVAAPVSRVLIDAPNFRLALSHGVPFFAGSRRWVLPLDGTARAGDECAAAGECLLVEPSVDLEIVGRALIGAEPA